MKRIFIIFFLLVLNTAFAKEEYKYTLSLGKEVNFNNSEGKITSGLKSYTEKVTQKSDIIFFDFLSTKNLPNFKLRLEKPEDNSDINTLSNKNLGFYNQRMELITYYKNSYDNINFNYGLSFRSQNDTIAFDLDNSSYKYNYQKDLIPFLYINSNYIINKKMGLGVSYKQSYLIDDYFKEQSVYFFYTFPKEYFFGTIMEIGRNKNNYQFSDFSSRLDTSGNYIQFKFNF